MEKHHGTREDLAKNQAIHRVASQQSLVGILGLPIFLPHLCGAEVTWGNEDGAPRECLLYRMINTHIHTSIHTYYILIYTYYIYIYTYYIYVYAYIYIYTYISISQKY